MDAHWIQVFHSTYDDYIVISIPEQFQFKLLPTQNCLLYQYFVCGGCIETTPQSIIKFRLFHYKSTSCTSECITGAYDQWKSDFLCSIFAFKEAIGNQRGSYRHSNIHHQLPESFSVFCDFDRV